MYDDQVFRWDDPPDGGHPGEAYNCRCVAEPIWPGLESDVLLVDFVPLAGFPLGTFLGQLGNRAIALTPLGAAALAALGVSGILQDFTRMATERRLERAADIMGVDLSTAEGLLATPARELVYEAVVTGIGSNLPKSSEAAEIAGQAAALYEMLNPGTILRVTDGDQAAQIALGAFVEDAYTMFEDGRLKLREGALADGWAEVFSQLDDSGGDILDLPGFTVEGYRALGSVEI